LFFANGELKLFIDNYLVGLDAAKQADGPHADQLQPPFSISIKQFTQPAPHLHSKEEELPRPTLAI